ncbi:sulfotransferase [Cyanobium sp. NS01]|uniref:sulfotransferase n=1 Tax=Cyanobium sp. NS01 TaxID=261284 RepID=UPI0016478815|nr:sulfotransferase [Cyanobium sp. NS01]QNI69365.1 sulfotransferase family protein [Cyanobium sp. NS01]
MNFLSRSSEGVLLVATGRRHRNEAITAVPRIRPWLGGRPLWLLTDKPARVPAAAFDRVMPHPDPRRTYRDKITALLRLPFRRTLFLDSDVELLAPLDDVFKLLDVVDLVGCHAPVRSFQWRDPQVPEGVCELNSGVLALRSGRAQHRLVRRWLTTYDEVGVEVDQAALRSALWWAMQRGLRSWVLPPEYNLRTTKPWIAGAGMAVKVVHGRIPDSMRAPLAGYLNKDPSRFRASSAFPTGQNTAVAPWPPVAPQRLFVLGAGRSGTSLLAGLFRRSGLFMGEASPYKPRAANPLGFFEDREVNAINEDLLGPLVPPPLGEGQRWLASLPSSARVAITPELRRRIRTLLSRGPFCFKDPRFCYTLDAWIQELPEQERDQVQCLCVFRHPSVVVASILKEIGSAPYLEGLQLTAEQVLQVWEAHYQAVLKRQRSQGRWLFIHYEELLQPTGLARLEAFTGLELDHSIVDLSLRRSEAHIEATPTSLRLYRTLLDLAKCEEP